MWEFLDWSHGMMRFGAPMNRETIHVVFCENHKTPIREDVYHPFLVKLGIILYSTTLVSTFGQGDQFYTWSIPV